MILRGMKDKIVVKDFLDKHRHFVWGSDTRPGIQHPVLALAQNRTIGHLGLRAGVDLFFCILKEKGH